MVNSVNLSQASYDTGGYYLSGYDYLSVEEEANNLISDEDGYLVKVQQLEGQARYLDRGKETVKHEVQPGETLSVIAYRYDLSMETILWANASLGSGNYLKVGQELTIPPADGLSIKVKKGDTWEALVKKYKTEVAQDVVVAWNESGLLEGADVFILGGRKPVEFVAQTKTRGSVKGTAASSFTKAEAVPGGWTYPTAGKLTQGFHYGHYAWDIADSSRPAIWASRGGTIVEAYNDGGWHGGYGNFILIDHGDGYQTLYGHNQQVYVTAGEAVTQGQVIAQMGNTGRVYGRTGIHVHFEVRYKGTKVNPGTVL